MRFKKVQTMKVSRMFMGCLYFLPAAINTLILFWIFVYPWLGQPENIRIPWQMLLILLVFWGSGILLIKGKWYGGIPASAIPAAAWLQSQSGYSGMSHIDWLPIAAVSILWCLLCAALVSHKTRRKQYP